MYYLAQPPPLVGGDLQVPGVFSLPTPYGSQNEYGYLTATACGTVATRFGYSAVAASSLAGSLCLSYFKAPKSFAATGLLMAQTVAGGTMTLVRAGLYQVSVTGDLTLVASAPNNAAALAGTNAAVVFVFSSQYTLIEGQQYAAGFIYTGTAGSLALLQQPANAITHFTYDSGPRVSGTVASQTDLLTSITAAQATASNTLLWGELF